MSALTGSNGILTISNTTDTYGGTTTEPANVQPQSLSYVCSVAGHLVLQDANGVTVLELYAAAQTSKEIDYHYFQFMRPWKAPIKASTLTVGTKVRITL